MRVLHLTSGNLYGGIESLLVTLARHRAACPEMEPQFAPCFEGRLAEELRASGAAVHVLGPVRVSRPWTVWRARRRLGTALDEQRPDVVVTHGCWPHALFAPVARRRRLPVAFWSHNVPTGRGWLERWAGQTPPALALANSRSTLSGLVRLFPGTAAELLYLPVPPPDVSEQASRRNRTRAALGTPAEAVVILMASRLEPWKGHDLLLEALAELADQADWVCWVAGGPQRPGEDVYLGRLQGRACRAGLAGRVRWLGQRRDVPDLLAAADIHCQPNTGPEPFGIAFIEAMYAGLPVVTTAMGGPLDFLDATCGILVQPGDVAALAAALRLLIVSPGDREKLGTAGAARARATCDPTAQLGALHRTLAGVG